MLKSFRRLLAEFCPVRKHVIFGLTELMINVVEHGNLGISYREKTLLLMENDYARKSNDALNCWPPGKPCGDRAPGSRTGCLELHPSATVAIILKWQLPDFDPSAFSIPMAVVIAMAHRSSFCSIDWQR